MDEHERYIAEQMEIIQTHLCPFAARNCAPACLTFIFPQSGINHQQKLRQIPAGCLRIDHIHTTMSAAENYHAS